MKLKKYLSIILLFIILITAGFLRLYRIRDYMGFLGDEGRDVLVVKRIIIDHTFTLLGPITSVGLMHLGPVYYYFMVPFLWLTRLDPVGPAIMVTLFSLATIILIWKMAEEFFDTKVAITASLLYGLSPLVITHSHSSWNPNILPFWSLFLMYSLTKALIKNQSRWWWGVGLAFGIAIQLHYVALVLAPIIFVSILLKRKRVTFKNWLSMGGGWLITFSPFLIFETRHRFINFLTIYQFVTRGGNAKTFGWGSVFAKFWDLAVRLFWRLIVVDNAELSILVMFFALGVCAYLIHKLPKTDIKRDILQIFFVWFGVGIGILSFYTGIIFDYYLMFAFPLPFFMLATALSFVSQNILGKVFVVIVIVSLVYFQITHTPILKAPNRLAAQAQEIADFILKKTDGQSYNFALIAKGNSDHAYRYFLEIDGPAPIVIQNQDVDPQRKSVAKQLFVVCEEKICQPLGYPLWEIAGFGRAEIVEEWNVGLFKVFKLVPYKEADLH